MYYHLLRSITCGICGMKHKLYGTQIERKLLNPGRNSELLYKCKKCFATLNIVRKDEEWKTRWFESPEMILEGSVRAEDL